MTGPSRERRFFLQAFAALLALPLLGLVVGSEAWGNLLTVGSICVLYMIAAQALNLQVGFTGLLNLGAVAFVGIGAYTAALLLTARNAAGEPALIAFWGGVLPQLTGDARWALCFLDPHFASYLCVAPVAVVLAVLLSLLLGLPTLKLGGDYFAIVTLGFAQIFYLVVKNEEWLTQGAFGVKDVPALFSSCQGPDKIEVLDRTAHYYFGVLVLGLAVYVAVRVRDSRWGRALAAIREDETAARANGVHVARYRILSFVLFSALAALAGVVFVARNKIVSPGDLDLWESILYLACIVLGGLGSVRGAFVGALILGVLNEGLRLLIPRLNEVLQLSIEQQWRYVILGVLLIVVMRKKPDGLLPAAAEEAQRGRERLAAHQDASPTLFVLGAKGAAP